jgi:hypothetical protein
MYPSPPRAGFFIARRTIVTLSTSIASQTFPGNGLTQLFPCAFRIFDEADVVVTTIDQVAGTSVPMTLNTDYTIAGAGDASGFTLSTTLPVADGKNLLVARVMPYTQPTDFTNQGAFFPTMHEDAMDRLGMQIQQLAGTSGRSLQIPDGLLPAPSPTLPIPSPLAPLAWNADGTALENGDLSGADLLLRPDLASASASKGASLLGFLQAGTGAVGSTTQKKLQRSLDLLDFVDPANYAAALAGTFDLSPALGKAIDEALARGADTVRLPAGMLLLNTKVTKALTGFQGLAIEGKGMGLTKLVAADPSGSCLQFDRAAGDWWMDTSPSNPLRLANFSVCATLLNLGEGIRINGGSLEGRPNAPCVFDHIEIRSLNGINNQAFLTGLHLNDCADSHHLGCRYFVGGQTNLTPTAVLISATDATTDPTVYNFDHCEWYYGGKGVVCGDNPEGIYLTQCTMVKVDQGVVWTAAAESGLHVIGGHYNCLSYCFNLDGVFDFVIANSLLFLTGASPQSFVSVKNGSSFSITDNVLYGGPIGIDVGTLPTGARGGYIGGNQFSNITTGINLSGAASNITVGPNGFTSVTMRVSGAGGAGSFIQKRSWSVSTLPTLVGGAAFENFTVAVPTNTFLAKPTVCAISADAATADYVCSYQSGSSTATSISVRIVRRDGAVITAGAARFNVVAYE